VLFIRFSAFDGDFLVDYHCEIILLSTERVRVKVRIDFLTLGWQGTWKSDLKVGQTIYYNGANKESLAMHVGPNNISVEHFLSLNLLRFNSTRQNVFRLLRLYFEQYKNSSGEEIANVNFYAVRPEDTRIR